MSVSQFCLGVAGQPPRIFMTTSEADAQMQLQAGEIYFEVIDYVQDPHIISEDGTKLVAVLPSLDELKAAKWREVLSYRNTLMNASCQTASGVVQIDSDSKIKILGAVSMASISKNMSQDFSIDWTMMDNSVVTLDAEAMIELGASVLTFVNACQANGTFLRNAIDAAVDESTLNAIDYTVGWPV